MDCAYVNWPSVLLRGCLAGETESMWVQKHEYNQKSCLDAWGIAQFKAAI